jgi:4-hydroxy-3-polyprenylbenzoate decarboxylase
VEVKTGPVKEHIHTGDDIDLFEFPAPRWHELDGGRYLGTGDMVIMRDPDEDWVNIGTHRVQIHDRTTATIFIAPGQHDAIIARKYWAKGLSCPVAVSCGQEPTLWLISTVRIPWGISEYDYAGWLKNKPVEVIRGQITDLPIPATAEIVLEGELVPPEIETRMEGPFGEYTGYYGGRSAPAPAFRVKSILHRNNPILLGAPPFRLWPLYWYGGHLIRAAVMWNEMDRQVPGVKGVWLSDDAAIRVPIISIKQEYAGHPNDAAMAAKLFGYIGKFIIIVDDDIDPSNMSEVIWAVGTRCDPETSINIITGTRASRLDPRISPEKRARNEFTGSTAIINACKPYHWIKDKMGGVP